MTSMIDIPITNFPYPNYNDPAPQHISAFGGRLVLSPVSDEAVQQIVRGKTQRSLGMVSAVAHLDVTLAQDFAPATSAPPDLFNQAACVCDLLSLASRRAVNFKPARKWSQGHKPVARGGFAARGPLMTNQEVSSLIENGWPKLLDPSFSIDRRGLTAIRWFMAGGTIPGWEVKLTWLWNVLEMLAKAHQRAEAPRVIPPSALLLPHQRTVIDRVIEPFLTDIAIPTWQGPDLAMRVNLRDIYAVRGHIAHGDPRMETETIRMFTPYMEKRDAELGRPATTDVSLKFGLCLYEAVHLLSRLLEKVFLNRFGAKDSWYYLRVPYHTSIAP